MPWDPDVTCHSARETMISYVAAMYGVSADLNLSCFIGTVLNSVTIAQHQIIFHFELHCAITVEGQWHLLDPQGQLVDESLDFKKRDAYRVHRCIGERVVAARAEPPESIALVFESGCVLRVTDGSRQYESFHLEPGDIHV